MVRLTDTNSLESHPIDAPARNHYSLYYRPLLLNMFTIHFDNPRGATVRNNTFKPRENQLDSDIRRFQWRICIFFLQIFMVASLAERSRLFQITMDRINPRFRHVQSYISFYAPKTNAIGERGKLTFVYDEILD